MQAIEKRNSLFNSLTQAIFDKEMANFWLQKVNPLWSVKHGLVQIVKRICRSRHGEPDSKM